MKIKRLSLNNFQIHREFDVDLNDMNLFCGPNRSGKTCIRDAIAFALSGYKMRGITNKKDLHTLVSSGAKKGTIRLELDNGEAVIRDVGTGKGDDKTAERIDPKGAALLVTDMRAFSRIKENERREILFRITGIRTDPQAVFDRLADQGLETSMIDSIKPLLRSGFAAAEKEARIRAREEKASWRAIIGETYGSEKAETWKSKGEHVDIGDMEERARELEKEGNDQQEHLNHMMQKVGAYERAEKERQSLTERIRELEHDASTLENYKKNHIEKSESFNTKNNALTDEISKAHNLKKTLSSNPLRDEEQISPEDTWHDECPSCGAELWFDEKTASLLHYVEDDSEARAELHEVELRIKGLKMQLSTASREMDNASMHFEKAKSATSKIEECKLSLTKLPKVESPDMDKINRLKKKISSIRAKSDDLRTQVRETRIAHQSTTQAKAHHILAQKYTALADALSPGGIQKEMLYDAIGPINDTLSKHSHAAGFPIVKIDENMTIMIGAMPYSLESESMQWRADAIISVTCAELSFLGFVVLDRFDVLDIPSRGKALSWLYGIRDEVQSIIMATMKQAPPDREGLTVRWLDGGVK